jgi:tagatose 1,6-diphosphate aldolase
VGEIHFRVGTDEKLQRFAGHVGYTVAEDARGHRFASRAIRLLIPLAKRHGLTELWITCNPDNAASRRTCEQPGAVFVEIVDLPVESDMYARGERRKCRYRIDLQSSSC